MKFFGRFGATKLRLFVCRLLPAVILVFMLAACGGNDRADDIRNLPEPGETKTPASSSGYQTIDVANGGTITGRVTLAPGAKVPEGFLSPSTQDVCVGVETNNRLEPGKEGGVPWGIVYLENVRSGRAFDAGAVQGIVLDQKQCQYLPHLVAARVGARVPIRNLDPIPHNVRIEEPERDSILLNIVQAAQGRVDSFLVDRAGPLLVKCDYHPWMNAYLFGVDNPYYAVTASDGSYSISGIPPGKYTLVFWFNGPGIRAKRQQDGGIVGYGFSEPIVERREVTIAAGGSSEEGFSVAP
jgi:plastocyanin